LSVAFLALISEVGAVGWIGGAHGQNPRADQSATAVTIDAKASENSPSPCGIKLLVSGGTFSPDVCQIEIISSGPFCADPKKCKPQYAISLKSNNPQADEVISVTLFNIDGLTPGTYRFDPSADSQEFKGELIDKGAVARHLLRGAITLDPQGDDKVQITLDLHFANDIAVRGSGLLAVKRVNAP
jgi:hypothetical protein